MHTSSFVKEIRQCSCSMCRACRTNYKTLSKWGSVRAQYRDELKEIVKGGDAENYNKHLSTRDYDA